MANGASEECLFCEKGVSGFSKSNPTTPVHAGIHKGLSARRPMARPARYVSSFEKRESGDTETGMAIPVMTGPASLRIEVRRVPGCSSFPLPHYTAARYPRETRTMTRVFDGCVHFSQCLCWF